MSNLLENRLQLPGETSDDDSSQPDDDRRNATPPVDGISSLVALANLHNLLILGDGYTENASEITVRVGAGTFAGVSVSRLSKDTSGALQSWHSEEKLWGGDRTAGQKVAIKQVTRRDSGDPSSVYKELANEIRVLCHRPLREHDNIVDIIGLGWTGEFYDDPVGSPRWPLLLLEWATCGTLETFFTLDDVDFSWDVKTGLSRDILDALQALKDCGVVHGDLKLSNVLVFRTGEGSFSAKLCDFGSATIESDSDNSRTARLTAFTPPWDAPESSRDIALDELYKVDIYGFGLLACRIYLNGGNPIEIQRMRTARGVDASGTSLVNKWKENDELHTVCKQTLRMAGIPAYDSKQLEILDRVLNKTVRTKPEDRADHFSQLEQLWDDSRGAVKPSEIRSNQESVNQDMDRDSTGLDVHDEEAQILSKGAVPPMFFGEFTRSIPQAERCWNYLFPPNIAKQIFEDIKRVASEDLSYPNNEEMRMRKAAAAYEVTFCYLQGFGCTVSYEDAALYLTSSAALGFPKAHNDIIRVYDALDKAIPGELQAGLLRAILELAYNGSPSAMLELQRLDPVRFSHIERELYATREGVGPDMFPENIYEDYPLENPTVWASNVGRADEEIPQQSSELEEMDFGDEQEGEGVTWLHYAAMNGSTDAVRLLLQNAPCDIDCRLDTQDPTKETPLWMACAAGHVEIVELLLDNRADAKAAGGYQGKTCLHMLQSFDASVVELAARRLIDAGADIEMTDAAGDTPLLKACLTRVGEGAVAAVRALVQHGANPAAMERSGYSCIDLAALNLQQDLLQVLISSPLLQVAPNHTLLPAIKGQALRALVRAPKLQRIRSGGVGYTDKIKAVLGMLITEESVSAYVNMTALKHNPLHDACVWGNDDLVLPLLDFPPVPLNGKAACGENSGMTPLLEALKGSHTHIVHLLISAGADVTVADDARRNILHYAVEFAPELLGFLVDHLRSETGAIADFVDAGMGDRNFTPLDLAVHTEHFEAARLLVSLGAQYKDLTRTGEAGELYSSLGTTGGSRRRMSFYLDMPAGMRPDAVVCSTGMSMFHVTAASFDNALLESDPSLADNAGFLLDHYYSVADAAKVDDEGNTPLHTAALFGNVPVAQTMLEIVGIDVNAVNVHGRTALDILEWRKRGVGDEMREMQLADDVERMSSKRRNRAMEDLLRGAGAVHGRELE